MAKCLRPAYVDVDQAQARFVEFADGWGAEVPAATKLWRAGRNEVIPFLDYRAEIRKIICTTNAIESRTARHRRAVRARGHFPIAAAGCEVPLPGH